jgi:hypothetical protein
MDPRCLAVAGGHGGVGELMPERFAPDSWMVEEGRTDFDAIPIATEACDRCAKATVDLDVDGASQSWQRPRA